MPESEHTQENLAYIRTHVERLEQLVRFEILANKRNTEAVVERLSGRAGMAEVYLALEGDAPKTQDELAAALHKSQPTVSRILKELYDAGFVVKVPSLANRQVMAYTWSDLEQLLAVSKLARRLLADPPKTPQAPNGTANGAAANGRARPHGASSARAAARPAPMSKRAPRRGAAGAGGGTDHGEHDGGGRADPA